ncbi:translation protein SH3-like domain-containing protein [Polychytrium aggregatum]|uniref:translation protein SH3-like domain-containing protein n=1 Tax=Polychytrium aggregatum TaxID=110093 RepID=UPI0022FEF3D3|nr:translation protein SH3-like domain-containing protein [Polychytrium aggregatum]KAI9203932.1 translation protein SH3-like domain-containing protein [Polychytrium aggregatum]
MKLLVNMGSALGQAMHHGVSHCPPSIGIASRLLNPTAALANRPTALSTPSIVSPWCSPCPFIASQIRPKTYRKTDTKGRKRYLKAITLLREQGIEPVRRTFPETENRFWKITGNMKVYKPVSPGCRHRRQLTRDHLWKGSCIHRLSFGKRSTGGRSTRTGSVTVRHRGGGHKRRVRLIDFMRTAPGPHEVVRLEYDPNRNCNLALLRNMSTNEFSYIIHPKDVNVGDTIHSWRSGIPAPAPGEEPLSRATMIKSGNCLRLRDLPIGTVVHNIGLKSDGPAQLCRSAGTSGQVLDNDADGKTGFAHVRLKSKEVRLIPSEACATVGVVGNEDYKLIVWGKAGASRRRGLRPSVRGIAQSPYDHPHGGGSKSKGNKHPRTPWGKKTKGWKTVRKLRKRWHIITPKWKAKMSS